MKYAKLKGAGVIPLSAFPMWAFGKDTCFKCGKKAKYYVEMGKDFVCFYKLPMKPPKEEQAEFIGGLCTRDYISMVKIVEESE